MLINEKVLKYIDSICKFIEYKPIHQSISDEIENHLLESSEVFRQNGQASEEAMDKAINQMGDPEIIGKQLNKIHRPKTEWKIIILTLILLCFGLFTLAIIQAQRCSIYDDVFNRQIIFIIPNIILSVLIFFFNYKKLEKYCLYTFLTGLILFLVVHLIDREPLVRPALILWVYRIPPAPVSLVIYVISFVGLLKKFNIEKIKNVFILIVLIICSVITIYSYLALNMVFILVITYLVLIITHICSSDFKGNKKKYLSILLGLSMGIILVSSFFTLINNPYIIERIKQSMNPNIDTNGAGWFSMLKHVRDNAILFGRGKNAFLYNNTIIQIPEISSDSIFTFVIGNFGFGTGIILIALIIALSIIMIMDSKKIKDSYGKLLIIGISTIFIMQCSINILMNLGLIPLTGMILPFISYNGTSLTLNMVMISLILSVYRRKDLIILSAKSLKQ